jgi:hypothetical protein
VPPRVDPIVTEYGLATPDTCGEVRLVKALDRRIAAQQADVRDLARLEEVVTR